MTQSASPDPQRNGFTESERQSIGSFLRDLYTEKAGVRGWGRNRKFRQG